MSLACDTELGSHTQSSWYCVLQHGASEKRAGSGECATNMSADPVPLEKKNRRKLTHQFYIIFVNHTFMKS